MSISFLNYLQSFWEKIKLFTNEFEKDFDNIEKQGV